MRRSLRARICLTVLLTLPALGLGTGTAGAAPDPSPVPVPEQGVAASPDQYRLSDRLERTLGDDTAGAYLDPRSGELVVTVTSAEAAAEVEAQGARAEIVRRGPAELRAAVTALESQAKITGTSWGLDPSTNQIAVQADSSVPAASLARLARVAAGLRGAVRIERVPGVFTREVAGGDAVHGGGYRCSAAFNVSRGGAYYFLTAGHCTEAAATWSDRSGGAAIGATEGSSFPGDDFGLVRYTTTGQPPGTVNRWDGSFEDVASAADAVVGQSLQKSGSTTRLTSGQVTAVNVTVNYSDGPVYGMVRTTICSAGGDSGGAHFSGTTALGIHSGSAGCTGTRGTAIHQPVSEPLAVYGVTVY
ncbi:S1 family peptidase [Streptomyces clavuligerus]|uniref:Glutamyl endopeptidase II n=1 Tax=Streptomyces clavuligerus TaxID=1901 RepID=E2PYA8_STRCL|nr:S1 family peptidase [Streptomyces clavuligerus]ANW17247.1 serine protease [Streptomyces clavuligerus]AXU11789.1 S1 family peptidase [Streptomyces clavuligerus]EFG10284.1 Glutamyl endopeptidase II [Streptomyces clavuligerus]MBY6301628.1 S1 family peptidase [Streptomyces clavuligerus]QCS04569.1 S1 family peptidase [Streptomyces clavuligerus]